MFLKKLPHSYLTLLGENGVKLSGGQNQLIGLVRALFHNPQVLLLDVPTAIHYPLFRMLLFDFNIRNSKHSKQQRQILIGNFAIIYLASSCFKSISV
ncbi:MAG: ATP-binding cassette domain-containing protein [Siphonobacter sp.]